MSTADARSGPATVILDPYQPDPDQPSRRQGRRLALAALGFATMFWGLVFAFVAPALIVVLLAPVILLGLLVLWAMPDVQHAPTGAIAPLFFTYTTLLIVWPFYIAISIPNSGLPWITPLRLATAPLVFVLFVCLSVSRDFRHRLIEVLRDNPWIAGPVIAFAGVDTVSVLFSRYPFFSLNQWVNNQIGWTCMFLAACWMFSKPGRVSRWAGLIWACAIVTGLIAIWEWRHQHLPWAGALPSFLNISPIWRAEITPSFRNYTDIYRTMSTFQSALGLGEYMSLSAPFILHFALGPHRPRVRIAAALTFPLICFVAYISNSRSGVIGVIIAAGLYPLYWAIQRWRRRQDALGTGIVMAYPVLAISGFFSTFFVGRIRAAVWGNGATDSSTQGRQIQYDMGIPNVLAHPWGYGDGMDGYALGYFQPNGLETIDTYYLSVALEYGILGFILFYGLILYSIYISGRVALTEDGKDPEISFLAPAAIALFSFVVIKSVYSETNNHPLYFMVLGMAAALIHRWKSLQRESPEPAFGGYVSDQDGGPLLPATPAPQPAIAQQNWRQAPRRP